MAWRLRGSDATVMVAEGDETTIGRNQLWQALPGVSRQHARISVLNGGLHLVSIGRNQTGVRRGPSAAWVWLNMHDTEVLLHGNEICLDRQNAAACTFSVQEPPEPEPPCAPRSPLADTHPAPRPQPPTCDPEPPPPPAAWSPHADADAGAHTDKKQCRSMGDIFASHVPGLVSMGDALAAGGATYEARFEHSVEEEVASIA
jgi:hypothetical protein